MVQANELRLGNLVADFTGRIGEVISFDKRNIELKMEFSTLKIQSKVGAEGLDVEPIPLTSELLEQIGFTRVSYGWDGSDGYNLYQSKANGAIFSCWREEVIGNRIKYLHQLQNAFYSLVQSELPIDISKLKSVKQ